MEANGGTRKRFRFLWVAHPAQALGETWLLGMLILFGLSRLVGHVSPFVLTNGIFFLCGASGMWAVLRIRLPQGSRIRQILWEGAVGIGLSLVMAAGISLPARLLGWEGVWLAANLGGASIATLLLLGTGIGYWIARGGVRLWFAWNRLRRRRMLWALTHAQLTVVAVVAVIGALVLFVMAAFPIGRSSAPSEAVGLFASLAERLLQTVLPALMLIAFMIVVILVTLLPPAALVSFLVARRTTRRLEKLATTASALREGDYGARVDIVGEDEVAQLQSDFNAMADELEHTLRDLQVQRDTVARLLESRRELVANVSHELRTPVATVRATLESALDRWLETPPDALHHDLEVMDGEIVRLQRLIDELFTLARADAGGLGLDCQPIAVSPVIQRMVEALAPLAWNSGRVEVVAEPPTEFPWVCADERGLEQILANLLRNGFRHTPPGGIVAVMTAAEEDCVRIEVRDTGEGIMAGDLPHIWERFYRGSSSKQAEKGGAGLGLALVKELAEAMGGTVEVESTVGQGSCFTVRLPKSESA